jgi:hypothetical protein
MNSPASSVPRDQRPDIQPRNFDMPIGDDTPRYFANNDPYLTHFMNALSCIFPGGERFFVSSVLAYQKQVTDPELKRQVRQFCAQESIHGQQHEAFNLWTERYGLGMAEMTKNYEATLLKTSRRESKLSKLATTAALEHMTAVLGNALLSNPEVQKILHPNVLQLWMWHAIEEIEHKAVAFDVYQEMGGTYSRRVGKFIAATIGLALSAIILMTILLWRDRQLFNVRSMVRFVRIFWVTGYAATAWRGYREYFRRDFHPWQTDDRKLLNKYLPDVTKYVGGNQGRLKEASA